jgi:hypothetical protein
MAAPSRWARQAALDTVLRFNPQRQALSEQIAQAKQTYGATVKAGRGTAQETEASVKRALPLLTQAYSGAGAAMQPGVSLVSQQLAALPPEAAQYRANQAASAQTMLANLAQAGAAAKAQMLERSTRAREGAQFSQQSAQRVLSETLKQIFGRQQALQGEAGAFAQSEAEKLANEAEGRRVTERGQNLTAASARAGRRVTERGQNITAQTAREGREAKAADKAAKEAKERAKGKGEWLTPVEHNKARDEIETIRNLAFGYRGQKQNYNQAKQILETKLKNRPAYPYSGRLKAGLDLAYFGGVGTGTAGLLHGEKLNLGKLGYPIYRPQQMSVGEALRSGFRAGGLRV